MVLKKLKKKKKKEILNNNLMFIIKLIKNTYIIFKISLIVNNDKRI